MLKNSRQSVSTNIIINKSWYQTYWMVAGKKCPTLYRISRWNWTKKILFQIINNSIDSFDTRRAIMCLWMQQWCIGESWFRSQNNRSRCLNWATNLPFESKPSKQRSMVLFCRITQSIERYHFCCCCIFAKWNIYSNSHWKFKINYPCHYIETLKRKTTIFIWQKWLYNLFEWIFQSINHFDCDCK